MIAAPHGSALEIREIESLAALEPYRAAWDELLSRAEINTIYQTYEWNSSWWRFFGRGRRLFVLLAFEGSTLIGVAPLQIALRRVNGRRERVLGFIGADNYASDYCDFIVPRGRRDVLDAMLQRLWFGADLWSVADFSAFPTHSPHFEAVEHYYARAGLGVLRGRLLEAPTIVLGNAQEERRLIGKKSLTRHLNRLRSSGEVLFEQYVTAAEALEYLPAFFEQHIRRWSGTPSPSLFLHPEQREFFRHIVEALSPRGWLRFALVRHDGRPVAFHLGFEYEGRFIWYKPSFDISLSKYSPGEVLLRFLLEYAVKEGLGEFDFTVGGEAFKHRFANLVRSNGQLWVFRRKSSFIVMKLRMAVSAFKKRMRLLLASKSGKDSSPAVSP